MRKAIIDLTDCKYIMELHERIKGLKLRRRIREKLVCVLG